MQFAIQQVIAGGVNYFTAAGNPGGNFVKHAFVPLRVALPGIIGKYTLAIFGTAATPRSTESLVVPFGRTITLALRWDQPFASIGRAMGSANSLAKVRVNAGSSPTRC